MANVILFSDLHDTDRIPANHICELEGRWRGDCNSGITVENLFDRWSHEDCWRCNEMAKTVVDTWYFDGDLDLSFQNETGFSVGECFRYQVFHLAKCIRNYFVLKNILDDQPDEPIVIWGPDLAMEIFLRFIVDFHGWAGRIKILKPSDLKPQETQQHSSPSTNKRPTAFEKLLREFHRLKKQIARFYQSTESKKNSRSHLKTDLFKSNAFFGSQGDDIRIVLGSDTVLSRKFQEIKNDQLVFETRKADWNSVAKVECNCEPIWDHTPLVHSLDTGIGEQPEFLIPWWKDVLAREWPDFFGRITVLAKSFRAYLLNHDVDLLLMPMAWTHVQRMQVSVANAIGIPTVCVQDGVLAAACYSPLSRPINSRYQLVTGPGGYQWALSHNYQPEQLIDVGNFLSSSPESNAQVESTLAHNDSNVTRFLFFASRYTASANNPNWTVDRTIDWVAECINEHPNTQLLFKSHPRITENECVQWSEDHATSLQEKMGSRFVSLPFAKNASDCFQLADWVISYCSTTLFQAIETDKPVILVDLFGHKHDAGAFKDVDRYVPVARTQDELNQLIRKIVSGNSEQIWNQQKAKDWMRSIFSPAANPIQVAHTLLQLATNKPRRLSA